MAIYTKTGDWGQTGLRGEGKRISKSTLQVSVLGTFDELNSQIGLSVAMLQSYRQVWGEDALAKNSLQTIEDLISVFEGVQESLLYAGAAVAQVVRPPEKNDQQIVELDQRFGERTRRLEALIDQYELQLPPLKNFILPGGGVPGAQLLVCRTVCRRAEREFVRWMEFLNGDRRRNRRPDDREAGLVFPQLLAYINRLSDWLFVSGRLVNHVSGEEEKVWIAVK